MEDPKFLSNAETSFLRLFLFMHLCIMNSVDNITFEDPFEVSVEINGELWKVTILPSYDHQKMESDFVVVIGDKFMGRLQMQILPRAWFWAEGYLSPLEAAIIGREIDKHYDQL